jgi:16S rRNA (cytidine1402-2'-O)-methyltransferase
MSILTDGSEPVAGVLYLVGTPIGNLGDLTPRAQRVLAGVQRIACEDTRRSGLLLHHLGLSRAAGGPPLLSFHQHNQLSRIPELLAALQAGEAIAVVSDAGLGCSRPAGRAAGGLHPRPLCCDHGPGEQRSAERKILL